MTRLPRRFSSPRNACRRIVWSHHLCSSGCSELSRKKSQMTSTTDTGSPPETRCSSVHSCSSSLEKSWSGTRPAVACCSNGLWLQRPREHLFGNFHRHDSQLLAQLGGHILQVGLIVRRQNHRANARSVCSQ